MHWYFYHILFKVFQIKQPTIAPPTQPRTSDTVKRNLCSQDSTKKIAISGNSENLEK